MRTSDQSLFTTAQETLFGMLANALFGQDYTPSEETDWEEVFREAYAQTVLLTAFSDTRRYGIPADTLQSFKTTLRRHLLKDSMVLRAHTDIHTILTEEKIPYVILKGAASAYYYPAPFLRGMGDVDFYVPAEHQERALALLLEQGFETVEAGEDHHTVLKKQGCKFELHFDLPGVPVGPAGDRIRALLEDLTDAGELTVSDTATFVRPTHLHHGLILLLHTQQHLLCEGLGLRHICDWSVFVRSMGESFTEAFREPLEAVGLWRFARILSLTGCLACGLPTAPWMEADPADRDTAEALLLDVLDGGNFGYKDKDRSRVYESQMISGSEQSDTEGSLVKNGFSAVNRWVRDQWPAARKCPLLLPFGWIYFLLRRLFLVVTGKRKAILAKNTLKNSRKRQDLYKKLGLFKPENHSHL